MKYLLILTFMPLFFGCHTAHKSAQIKRIDSTIPEAEAYSFNNTQLTGPFQLNYLQFLPEQYDDKDEWPLMLFLHGAGERGDDLSKVAIQGPPKLAAQGQLQEFVIIAPQCPENDYWDTWQQQSNLIALLNQIEKDLKIDPNRIYVTGLSMGGFGTWSLAAAIPNRIAAAVPVCGGGNVWTADFLIEIPIWAFHGAKDDIVPPAYSEDMVNAINKAGGHAKLTIFPDANHNSWDSAYEHTEGLYQWMLDQNLQNRVTKNKASK